MIDDQRIEPSALPDVVISNPSVDRIVNHVVDKIALKIKPGAMRSKARSNKQQICEK
jgi:hypothetical protein